MPNPNPRQTEEFKKHWYKPVGEAPPEKLERTPVAVTVGKSIYAAIQSLERPDRITWLRRVITEAAKRELMGELPPSQDNAPTETAIKNETPPPPPDAPPVDVRRAGELKALIEKRLAESTLGLADKRIFRLVQEFLDSLE